MKYYLKDKKTGIKDFKVEGTNLFYVTSEGLFFNDALVAKVVDRTNYSLYDDIIVYSKGGTTYLGEEKIDKTIFISTLDNDTALFSSNFNLEDLTLHFELINLKNLSLIYDFGQLPIIKNVLNKDNQIYLQLEEKLVCMSHSSKKVEWELKKDALKLIGVYQNQLLVACSDHLLLLIDVNTGEIRHKWRDLIGFEVGSFYKNVLPDPTNFVLDKKASKLIGVFDTYYFEIDLDSKEISYYQLKEELSKYGINDFRPFNNNPFTSEHLFLTAHTYLKEIPNVDLSSVLVLNRETKRVDWLHTFKENGLGTNVPQITDTHLYQLDTEGTLHIFEKE